MIEMSRQRKWQAKKKAQGLCTICGKKKIYKGSECEEHYRKSRLCNDRWRDNHKEEVRLRNKAYREKQKKEER